LYNLHTFAVLKANIGADINDKKKSILDSTPAVLVEHFTMFDDNKNNNQESINMLKEQVVKSSLENDINNYTKNADHALFKCGNFTIVNIINIHLGLFLYIFTFSIHIHLHDFLNACSHLRIFFSYDK